MTSINRAKPAQTGIKTGFLVYYQGFLAVMAVLLFFSKLDVYLEGRGIGIPLLWLGLLILAGMPVFVGLLSSLQSIPGSIVLWCGFYLAVPLLSILILPQVPDIQLFEDQIRSVIFLLVVLAIYSRHLLVLKWTKLTIFSVTIANVLMFIWEFFNPTAFYQLQHAPGRSSGFYRDANTAGIALILGLIFSIDLIKPKYRLLYSIFVFVGIAATFSRGAILAWGVVMLLFLVNRIIPRSQLPLMFLSAFMAILLISSQLGNLEYVKTADGTELFNEGTLARVEFLLDPLGQEDESGDSRLGYVDDAWAKFDRQPILGNGLGSGASQDYLSASGKPQRSHNIYLDQMVEFGFLGALIYPLLLLACVWKAAGEHKKYVAPFVFCLLLWGIFSHTTLNSFFLLTSYAIMANLTKQSRIQSL